MGKHALVIEGGGMKAAYANGVLSAFEEAGYAPWSAVYGTSAGGALAAWMSAGQAVYAEETWSYARDPRILNYRRGLFGRGPLLDHEALLEIIYREEHPLDVVALRKAEWPVVVTASDVVKGACVYQDLRNVADPIVWIKATGRLPFGSGPPVRIDGRDYLDGGILDPVPIRHAVEADGATEVTLILNKPPGPGKADNKFLVRLAAQRFPALRAGLEEHQERKQAAYAYAYDPPVGITVHVVRPTRDTGLGRFTRDISRLRTAIDQGRADGAHAMETLLQTTR